MREALLPMGMQEAGDKVGAAERDQLAILVRLLAAPNASVQDSTLVSVADTSAIPRAAGTEQDARIERRDRQRRQPYGKRRR